MSRIAYLDAGEGIAGDMFVAALVDAGAPVDAVVRAVEALDIGVTLTPVARRARGIVGTGLDVETRGAARLPTLADQRRVLEHAALDRSVEDRAQAVLERLVAAESAVHGTSIEETHLHDLGDADTLVDVVAACQALEALGVGRLWTSMVALGGGQVRTDHGTLTVPAPAVAELVQGLHVRLGGERELTTPTGAALLAELAEPDTGNGVPLRLERSGRGFGTLGGADASICTVHVGQPASSRGTAERRLLVEATVDDLSPEWVPHVLDRLRELGADDAWSVPCQMKKGRHGATLTALAAEHLLDDLVAVLHDEAGTLGVRWFEVTKRALARRWCTVGVEGQPIAVKLGERSGEIVTCAPEADDVLAAARQLGRPAREVFTLAQQQARTHLEAADTPDAR